MSGNNDSTNLPPMPPSESQNLSKRPFNPHFENDIDSRRVSPPSHRHAAPSAPWPWMDLEDAVNQQQLESPLPPVPKPCTHYPMTCNDCWKDYPHSLFPNWTQEQVQKSKLDRIIDDYRRDRDCVIHQVDIDESGLFKVPAEGKIVSNDKCLGNSWDRIVNVKIPEDTRVRALFVENLSGPVLQMLGAKYNIEPFFFTSSLNWIPSRYQEGIKPGVGDHITICLTFLRSVPDGEAASMSAKSPYTYSHADRNGGRKSASTPTLQGTQGSILTDQIIDTQAPLSLKSNHRLLILDLLSVHLVRRTHGSTIISYHADKDLPTTTAPYLHERIRFAGQSVYWQSIFQSSPDPTFVLLTFVWHALYAWDEALENLYSHICSIESRVITTSEMGLTQELHVIRAHHLHYSSLLEDFKKTVIFIRDTVNPALEKPGWLSIEERKFNQGLMNRECQNLLTEIDRLQMSRRMQERRLKNVMHLVFSSVNIIDSRRMQKMTEAASRDSAAMKQIAYLTMVFLPASFVAAVFGMNVKEIVPDTHGTLSHYAGTAIPFTLMTIWIIVASQSKYVFTDKMPFWKRLGWPVLLLVVALRGEKEDMTRGVYGGEQGGVGKSSTSWLKLKLDFGSWKKLMKWNKLGKNGKEGNKEERESTRNIEPKMEVREEEHDDYVYEYKYEIGSEGNAKRKSTTTIQEVTDSVSRLSRQ